MEGFAEPHDNSFFLLAQVFLLLLCRTQTTRVDPRGGHSSPESSDLWLFSSFLKTYSRRGKTAYVSFQEKDTSLKHDRIFQISLIVGIVVEGHEDRRDGGDSNCSLCVWGLLVQADFWSPTVVSTSRVAAEWEERFPSWSRTKVTSSKDQGA